MSRGREPKKPPTWAPDEQPPPVGAPGWLDWFDLIVMHTSGGADSQEMMRRATDVFRAAGVMHKVAALHIWLDRRHDLHGADRTRVEWQQVPQLAAEQGRRCGLPLADGDGWAIWDARERRAQVERDAWAGRLHFARRINRDGSDWRGDLLDDIATRRKQTDEDKAARRPASGDLRGWPTMWTRYCTSDWKTAVGSAFTRYLCKQIRRELGIRRPMRVLQVMGFRAEESDDRRDREPYALNYGVSAEMSRWVWEWLPIHTLTKRDRWDAIRASGIPYHPVYDEGMSRLSCRRCVLASRRDLATARRLDPDGTDAYIAVESDLDDPFQHRRPLASIEPAPGPRGFAVRWTSCPTCDVPTLARADAPARPCPAHALTGPWDLLNGDQGDAPACGSTPFLSGWSALVGGTR